MSGKHSDRDRDEYSETETARRANAALRVALNTPHKPHSESKIGKPSAKRKASPQRTKPVKKPRRP
jgi:hypothetical protein